MEDDVDMKTRRNPFFSFLRSSLHRNIHRQYASQDLRDGDRGDHPYGVSSPTVWGSRLRFCQFSYPSVLERGEQIERPDLVSLCRYLTRTLDT